MTGILCVNKPKDITSFGVVSKVRGITREKKAGHTGTLDPMATGVLPVMLGGATRFLDYLPDSDKGYRANFVLGKTTDTLDITGKITQIRDVKAGIKEVLSALDNFRGEINQIPPMYCAKSIDGVRLYDLARKGIEVERKPNKVNIKKLELVSSNNNEYTIDVICSKGTYIRSLISDIGELLGCGATMIELERTLAMGFTIEDCVTLDELQSMRDNEIDISKALVDIEKMFKPYDEVYVSSAQAKRFSNGGALFLDRIRKPLENGLCRVYSPERIFLGLGYADNDSNELKVERLLVRRD